MIPFIFRPGEMTTLVYFHQTSPDLLHLCDSGWREARTGE